MFNFFKNNNNNNNSGTNGNGAPSLNHPQQIKLNLSKEEALLQLDLRKEKVSNICMGIPALKDMKSKVALVLDFSGSMEGMFRDGTVQSVIERIIPIALQFDDNQELDFWIFENGFKRLQPITKNNFYGLAEKIYNQYSMGGTKYSPVMRDVIKKYSVDEPSDLPAYVLFITDGDNFDKSQTTTIITDNCTKPIFWQCVGVGTARKDYLQQLDDLPNREMDNVDFFNINNPNAISDEELYNKLFDEYPSWVIEARRNGIIR